jgi:hypothetical protein
VEQNDNKEGIDMDKKWLKRIVAGVGALGAGIGIMLGLTVFGHSAISQLVGLAVAQSTTLWNNVIDAAKGDAQLSGILGQSPYLYNGLSFDRARGDTTNGMDVDVTRISGSITPADAYANPTTANQIWSLNGVFNGTTWDRQRTTTADALASTGIAAGNNVLFNGSTFDRQDSASAANNTATTTLGVAYSTPLSTWSVTNTQSGAVQATASKATGGGTVRHVATSITVCRGDTAVAAPAQINLRDGATGAGTIIRSWVIGVSAVNESRCIDLSGLNMTGTANTAMTLEFAAAGSVTSLSTVTLTGYSTP